MVLSIKPALQVEVHLYIGPYRIGANKRKIDITGSQFSLSGLAD